MFKDFEHWLHEHFDFIEVEDAFTAEELDDLFKTYDLEQKFLSLSLLLG